MNNIYFVDNVRQEEIDTFYNACQRHRDYYRGYPKAYHPLEYFREPGYSGQCPEDMTSVYISYPRFHVKYKQPHVLPRDTGRTGGFPSLPERNLGGRYNKNACKLFNR